MTIGELKKILEQYENETEIVLAKDEEGNSFSPLMEVQRGLYKPLVDEFGEVYDVRDKAAAGSKSMLAIILWPRC